jgi:hypothetical protein
MVLKEKKMITPRLTIENVEKWILEGDETQMFTTSSGRCTHLRLLKEVQGNLAIIYVSPRDPDDKNHPILFHEYSYAGLYDLSSKSFVDIREHGFLPIEDAPEAPSLEKTLEAVSLEIHDNLETIIKESEDEVTDEEIAPIKASIDSSTLAPLNTFIKIETMQDLIECFESKEAFITKKVCAFLSENQEAVYKEIWRRKKERGAG